MSDDSELINRERLLEISDGDQALLKQFFEIFFEDSKRDLEQLSTAIQNKEMEQIRRLAHKCSGASGQLGLNGISLPLKDIEIQVTQGNDTNVHELFNTARTNWERCLKLTQTKPLL
jgi:HPt (histidine-containing phosphotransfer) domain-containing protein